MTGASRSQVLGPESWVPPPGTEDSGPRTQDPLGDIPPDEGCDLAPSCLGCPFPRCRYDDPGLVRRLRHGTRRQEQARRLAALAAEVGWTMEEVAGRLGVSRRTAFRLRAGGAAAGELAGEQSVRPRRRDRSLDLSGPTAAARRRGTGLKTCCYAGTPLPGAGRGPKEVQR